jgi:hypothetical protein
VSTKLGLCFALIFGNVKRQIVLLFTLIPLALFGEESSFKTESPPCEKQEQPKQIEPAKKEEATKEKTEENEKQSKKEEEEKPKKEEEKPKKEEDKKEEFSKKGPTPTPIGNFALPTSQQIAPLVGFGQLVAGAEVLQYYLVGNFFEGNDTFTSTLIPAILYGITDEVDVYLQLPFSPGNYQNKHRSAGIEDIILQFEYAYYTLNTCCYINQATVVSYISYPTGDSHKTPPTGFGSPAFFIGGTFSHVSRWWYSFFSTGGVFPTETHGTKFGDEFLYQFGYERVICAIKDRMIFAWMVELDGTYSKKNRIHGMINPDSGGNTILITPSFWFSTKRWIVQGGVGFPVVQNLNGDQPKNNLALFFIIGYTL